MAIWWCFIGDCRVCRCTSVSLACVFHEELEAAVMKVWTPLYHNRMLKIYNFYFPILLLQKTIMFFASFPCVKFIIFLCVIVWYCKKSNICVLVRIMWKHRPLSVDHMLSKPSRTCPESTAMPNFFKKNRLRCKHLQFGKCTLVHKRIQLVRQ